MDVSFAELQPAFEERVSRIVWCQMATVDRQGRPRMRLVHPVWEGTTAWITTRPGTHKFKHLAKTPFVSLGYWDHQHELVYAECAIEQVTDRAELEHAWQYFNSKPGPYGFDPTSIAPSLDDPTFALLKGTAWRIEVRALQQPPMVWRADS